MAAKRLGKARKDRTMQIMRGSLKTMAARFCAGVLRSRFFFPPIYTLFFSPSLCSVAKLFVRRFAGACLKSFPN